MGDALPFPSGTAIIPAYVTEGMADILLAVVLRGALEDGKPRHVLFARKLYRVTAEELLQPKS